ncbi:MAG: hypothetical protein ICV64_05500 [Thermoleophilia bacterium]|nr:hypothetical protein [Thermoleophilia bacterium]
MEITVEARYNGPAGSGNGGYTCGLVGVLLGGPAEVTLRRPPPLATPLRAERRDGGVAVYDGDALVAEGVRAEVALDPPAPVAFADAEAASRHYLGFREHAFPTCFVCGPARAPGDGLRVFAAAVPGRDVVAAPWAPAPELAGEDGDLRPEFVWAALDCPGAFAVGFAGRGELLLGRLAARVDHAPRPRERCVVVGWPLGEEGRKLYAGTALFSDAGDLYAIARATWIEPRSAAA